MRKSAETPTRPTMPKVEETKTSLTTTNPAKEINPSDDGE
jgi:hypothetical protein